MLHYRNLILLFLLVGSCCGIRGQSQPTLDSNRVFEQTEFLDWVRTHHPIAQQARLLDRQAVALEREARGGFDPKAYADWDQKSFDKKEYFAIGEGGFKLPTWYGVELKGAYAITDGIFLNPENNLPDAGQAILGVTVPLGQGLVIDNRRAALEQAKLMADANEAERRRLLNDLLMDAAEAYWEWTLAYNELLIYEQALDVSEQRLEVIIESFRQGDKPAIDTLETLIQVQNRQLDLNEARRVYANAGLLLSNFLWYDGHIPLELSEQLRPPRMSNLSYGLNYPSAATIWQLASPNHPELRFYEVKRQQLEVDRRLAAEQLKPRLDVNYNFLGEGTNFINGQQTDERAINTLVTQNFKWGLQFEMPLLLRKERGKLDLARLKIQDNELFLEQKRIAVQNKINEYFNNLVFIQDQIDIYASAVDNYQALLNAELIKFQQGESSIFLINSREQKLIDAQLKLASLRAKFQKNEQGLEWAAGQLGG